MLQTSTIKPATTGFISVAFLTINKGAKLVFSLYLAKLSRPLCGSFLCPCGGNAICVHVPNMTTADKKQQSKLIN